MRGYGNAVEPLRRGEQPSSGEVRICGLPYEYWPPYELAQRFRVLRSSASLFIGVTVVDLLRDRCRGVRGELIARRVMAVAGIESLAMSDWRLLQHAERQRVQLACTLASTWAMPVDLRLLVVNDGVAELQNSLGEIVLRELRDFARARNAGVLTVTMDAGLAERHADRLLVLQHEKGNAPVMH